MTAVVIISVGLAFVLLMAIPIIKEERKFKKEIAELDKELAQMVERFASSSLPVTYPPPAPVDEFDRQLADIVDKKMAELADRDRVRDELVAELLHRVEYLEEREGI